MVSSERYVNSVWRIHFDKDCVRYVEAAHFLEEL